MSGQSGLRSPKESASRWWARPGLRSPLGRAMGLGSAKEGIGHWWAQRITALVLVPLLLWFVASIVSLTGQGRGAVTAWLHSPFPAIATVLMLIAVFYHSALGIHAVIEDYIHTPWRKISAFLLNDLANIALATCGIFAVLRIAFQG